MTGHERNTVASALAGSALVGDSGAVVRVDPVADPRWDELVRSHPDACPYHLGAWAEVLRSAYGDRPCYLGLADGEGRLRAGLPLMRTRGLVTRTRMRTLPVVPPAGPLAGDAGDARALIEAACRLTDGEGARIWTLHARRDGYERLVPALRPVPKFPTWILDLPGDTDELRRGWKKGSNNLWRNLRKADRTGAVVREGSSEADLRAFYRLYLETMRRRHALPRPWRQFREDRRLLGPDGTYRLFVVEHEGAIVSGGLYHVLGGTVDLLYQGSAEAALEVRANHALYWHVIEWAAAAGHRRMDYGYAREGTSLARFKAQWGAREVPEYRYDYVPGSPGGAAGAPAGGARPLAGRGSDGAIERLWERAPLGAIRAASTLVYRYL